MVGCFQERIVSRTPSSISPWVVKPVTRLPLIIDSAVTGLTVLGKMAPPWQLGVD